MYVKVLSGEQRGNFAVYGSKHIIETETHVKKKKKKNLISQNGEGVFASLHIRFFLVCYNMEWFFG